jgi:hypothetical protein
VEQTPEAEMPGDPDIEHRNMSTANKIRLVQTVLAAVVAAFAISVVVAGHWWTTPPPPPPSVNLALLKDQVVGSLRTRLNTDDLFKDYEITVDADLTLINTDLKVSGGHGDGRRYWRDDVPDGPGVGVSPNRGSQGREAERLADPGRRPPASAFMVSW